MLIENEIIVVAPNEYATFARQICHEIAKLEGYNAAFWSIKQFEDNEFQLGGNRYAIFIGNANENKYTKDFLPVIINLKNKAGVNYGFDGTKAVVFGDGNLDQEKEFRAVREKATKITCRPITGIGFIYRPPIFDPFSWAIDLLFEHFRKKEREKKLRKEQTKVAITFFMLEHFGKWIGIEKEE